ncbi:ammonium transporter [Agrilactobacillus fermenti]|uniref:ammonium transporter n=1 Tax=Agrilactobacillus fermenti TaxID=2586909 RepID=UPI001E2DA329|nr:ammonium transporter [Agrilactobacillus fermenti]MCD2256125.1 ammonium transporter [Agrilactobacillus fermenti]
MNGANTAFVLTSSILVLFMTPGLAFFYGGLVSRRNVVNTMFSVFFICGIAALLWVAFGYDLSFNNNIGGIVGTVSHWFLGGLNLAALTTNKIPTGVYMLFQLMFAIITPALFVGAVVGRLRFNFLMWFIVLWSLFVYYPLVHMVWSPHGLLAGLGVLDFAGGTVVHINAGITALVLSIFLGKRLDYGKQEEHYNIPWVLLGTAILWIGWYGFNAGSALGINNVAVQAAITSTVSTAAAMITWMVLDIIRTGKPTLVGVCTGTLCGLVGITPAAGYVTVAGSFWIGLIATSVSYLWVNVIKGKIGVDDTLDAFGCHGVSGIVGSILTGVFATKAVNPLVTHEGLIYGGSAHLFMGQLLGTVITIVIVAVMVTAITAGLRLVVRMRVDEAEERTGLDMGEHGEAVDYTISLSAELDAFKEDTKDVMTFPDEFKGQLGRFDTTTTNLRERPTKSH